MTGLPKLLGFSGLLLSILLFVFGRALDHELTEIRTRLTALEARMAKIERRLDYLEAVKEKMQLAPFEGHFESRPPKLEKAQSMPRSQR